MSQKIKIDGLNDAIQKELKLYSDRVTEGIKKAVDVVSTDLLANTKADAPAKSGKYKKAMRLKQTANTPFGKTKVWYVAAPHYRLAHLLEYGHATANGGRARAFPHIKKNEEQANERLEKEIKDIIRKGV